MDDRLVCYYRNDAGYGLLLIVFVGQDLAFVVVDDAVSLPQTWLDASQYDRMFHFTKVAS